MHTSGRINYVPDINSVNFQQFPGRYSFGGTLIFVKVGEFPPKIPFSGNCYNLKNVANLKEGWPTPSLPHISDYKVGMVKLLHPCVGNPIC